MPRAVVKRTLVVRGGSASYIGRRYSILLNTLNTLGYSHRDVGWRASRLVRKVGPVAVFKRTR